MSEPIPGDLGFSYEFGIDIDMAYPDDETPDWVQVAFITDAGDANEKTKVDTATYYDRGAARNAITGENWTLTFTHQLHRNPDGTYIAVLAKLVEASKFGKRNKDAKVHVRWYDTEGASYAFEGEAYVSRARTAQGNAEVGGFTFTLEGDGAAVEIENPNAEATAPTLSAANPATSAASNVMVKITGDHFSTVNPASAAAVKFGAENAAQFFVDDDNTIYARMPTGTAGPLNITVTNPTGTSSAFTYARA